MRYWSGAKDPACYEPVVNEMPGFVEAVDLLAKEFVIDPLDTPASSSVRRRAGEPRTEHDGVVKIPEVDWSTDLKEAMKAPPPRKPASLVRGLPGQWWMHPTQ